MVLETAREQQHVGTPQAAANAARPQAPLAPGSASVDDLLEFAIGWADATYGAGALVAAREDFHVKTGKAFHADPFFDSRTSYFFEYFLFQRPIKADPNGEGLTPFQELLHSLDEGTLVLAGDVAAAMRALGEFRHSLFMVKKAGTQTMTVLDLIGGKKYRVTPKSDEIYAGFEKGNVLQAFLFPRADAFHLGLGLVLHATRAAAPITKLVKSTMKEAQKSGKLDALSLLFKLAALQIRQMRHRHVDPKKIYTPAT